MDARPEVCRRVCPVERSHQPGEDILTRHHDRPQVVAVWPERADDQENRHPGKQEGADPKIIVPVLKEEVEDDHRYIGEPKQVGNDENLTEGDEVVRSDMDQAVAAGGCYISLQPGKPLHVDKAVEQKRQRVPVFIVIKAADPEKGPRHIFFWGHYFFHISNILIPAILFRLTFLFASLYIIRLVEKVKIRNS